jgi:hypothetical protein
MNATLFFEVPETCRQVNEYSKIELLFMNKARNIHNFCARAVGNIWQNGKNNTNHHYQVNKCAPKQENPHTPTFFLF